MLAIAKVIHIPEQILKDPVDQIAQMCCSSFQALKLELIRSAFHIARKHLEKSAALIRGGQSKALCCIEAHVSKQTL